MLSSRTYTNTQGQCKTYQRNSSSTPLYTLQLSSIQPASSKTTGPTSASQRQRMSPRTACPRRTTSSAGSSPAQISTQQLQSSWAKSQNSRHLVGGKPNGSNADVVDCLMDAWNKDVSGEHKKKWTGNGHRVRYLWQELKNIINTGPEAMKFPPRWLAE